jgi:hypothetical protein
MSRHGSVVFATLLAGLLWAALQAPRSAAAAAPTEQQVQAAFLFNFSSFVDWPADAFSSPAQPFVICLLGAAGLAANVEEAVRGESVDGRPMRVRRFDGDEEPGDCQILFIDDAQEAQLARILDAARGRRALTVSDLDGASRRGVMVQLVNDRNRIRLMINIEAARAAGLTISSSLLRAAEIVRTGPEAAR